MGMNAIIVIALAEKELMLDDIRSRIWCTYRRNFRPISEFHVAYNVGLVDHVFLNSIT